MEFYSNSTVELINFTGGDEAVARAAWVSNIGEESKFKDADSIGGLIKFLYTNRHLSPFEHGQFTFYVQTPIFVAREFHRHRTWSYNEVSGRYSEMKPRFYLPPAHRPMVQSGKIGLYKFVPGDAEQVNDVQDSIIDISTRAWDEYMFLKKRGVANEVARMVLPVNLMTEFYATVNPRNLMAFLDLRADDQALFEIREGVAKEMIPYLEGTMPLTHKTYMLGKSLDAPPLVG